MKKILIRSSLALLVLLVVVLLGVYIWIDRLAKMAVERGSTYALGVPTTLDSARVGVFSGQMGMTSLNVANPRNFSAPHFLKLKTGQIDVSLSSLRQDTVVIPLLELKGVDVNLEKKSGQSNYQVILDNLKKLDRKSVV